MPGVAPKTILKLPEVDIKKYRAELDKFMEAAQTEAIRRWLINVLKHTPKYTGTARGTYEPIGRVVGHNVRRITNTTRKNYFVTKSGTRWPLGFEAGANYSDYKIVNRKYKDSLRYRFEFDQRLPYVLWNEISPAGSDADDPIPSNKPLPSVPPWLALKSGAEAFRRRIRRLTKDLPVPNIVVKIEKGG